MMSLRQYKLYVSGVRKTTCASNVELPDLAASAPTKQKPGNGEKRMKVTMEITKRYTFGAEVSGQEEAEILCEQLTNAARTGNVITLPDGVQHGGTDVDGAITFVDVRW